MLINEILDNENKKLITEDNLPLLFDSGNPFMRTQTVRFAETKSTFKPEEIYEYKTDSRYENYLNNQIEYSLSKLGRFKNNLNVLNDIGLSYLAKGDYRQAATYFEQALAIDPDFYSSNANLAKIYFSQGQYEDSLDIYKKLSKLHPEDTKIRQNISHIFLRMNDIKAAICVLTDALRIKEDASTYNNLGVLYIIQGQVNKAIAKLRQALNINTSFANAYNNLGVCYSILKEHEKALKYYHAAILINKDFIDANKNIARTHYHLRNYNKCLEVLNTWKLNNLLDNEMLDIMANCFFEIREYKKTIEFLKRVIAVLPVKGNDEEKARIYNNIAIAYSGLGDKVSAKEYFQMSINLHATEINYFNFITFLLMQLELSEVDKIIMKAIEEYPDNHELLILKARYLYEIEDIESTCQVLKKVIAIKPDSVEPYILLNHIYEDYFNDNEEALKVAFEGMKYNQNNVNLKNNLIYSLLQSNNESNIKKATNILNDLKGIDNPYIIATRGLSEIKLGNLHEGEKLYNRAIAFAGNNIDLQHRIKQKKHLELGKYYLRIGDKYSAINQLKKTTKIKSRKMLFVSQADNLLSNILKN